MIIINADDWGRSCLETDAALSCYAKGTITSMSAMVFMQDSQRAAALAKEVRLPVGLHLNLNESLEGHARDSYGTAAIHRAVPGRSPRSRQLDYPALLGNSVCLRVRSLAA